MPYLALVAKDKQTRYFLKGTPAAPAKVTRTNADAGIVGAISEIVKLKAS